MQPYDTITSSKLSLISMQPSTAIPGASETGGSKLRLHAKKATFSLRPDVLAALDEAVANGTGVSKNAFVEEALLRALRDRQRDIRRAQWETAARDPLFMRDLADVEQDFRDADAETTRVNP